MWIEELRHGCFFWFLANPNLKKANGKNPNIALGACLGLRQLSLGYLLQYVID